MPRDVGADVPHVELASDPVVMTAEIRALLARRLPSYDVRTVSLLGAGLQNVAYDVNGELVVRVSIAAADQRGALVAREAEILRRVGTFATLPVPSLVFADEEAGALAYDRLPGTSLLDEPRLTANLGAQVGTFLGSLHAAAAMADVAPRDTFTTSEWLTDAGDQFAQLTSGLNSRERVAIETFLATAPPPSSARETFCHNDFGAEHILVGSSGRLTGVIDWSDAAMTDPAYDWGLVWRDLGPRVFTEALAHYSQPFDDTDIARAVFYARCSLLEDFAYGIRDGRAPYLRAARRNFRHTFAV